MNILHYTANTEDIRESKSSEIDKGLYLIFTQIIKEAENNEYAEVLDGVKMQKEVQKLLR